MSGRAGRDSHLRRWGAVYLLGALFLGSWIAQFVTQAIEFGNEARDHASSFAWSDYWPSFLSELSEIRHRLDALADVPGHDPRTGGPDVIGHVDTERPHGPPGAPVT